MKTQKREVPAGTGNGGGKFLKIEIGQSVNGVFRGDPQVYWRKWPKGGVKVESDVEQEGFEERYKVNFVINEGGVPTPKIFDMNLYTYNQLADINESYDVETIKVKISRQPTGKGSTYLLLPLLKEPIPPSFLKQLESIELIELKRGDTPAPTGNFDSEIPF